MRQSRQTVCRRWIIEWWVIQRMTRLESGETSNEGSREQVEHGSILIGNDGCGMYWHLIISRPDRGIPWMVCGEGIQPVGPKRDFLQWYEDWLDGRDSFYGYHYKA